MQKSEWSGSLSNRTEQANGDERRNPRVTAIFERLAIHGRTEGDHDRRELSVVRSPVGLLRPANL